MRGDYKRHGEKGQFGRFTARMHGRRTTRFALIREQPLDSTACFPVTESVAMNEPIRLTQYSHGAGWLQDFPKVLDVILAGSGAQNLDPRLWVGNASRDDAAVYALDDERGVVSTTDFFMPIVDDPFDFGRIAATNAISDIYAMGGDPLMAIAILGWPVNILPPEVAREVIRGGRAVCDAAGIPLAGGHSIDAPEPIFGLAVTGVVQKKHMKRNDTALAGSTFVPDQAPGHRHPHHGREKSKLRDEDIGLARDWMCTLNKPGSRFGKLDGVQAMTDVTGFGLLGHLVEMADGAGLTARLDYAAVPRLPGVEHYIAEGCVPGGTMRNFESYGDRIGALSDAQRDLLCDPQTSGGLLVAVSPEGEAEFLIVAAELGLLLNPIGTLHERQTHAVEVF